MEGADAAPASGARNSVNINQNIFIHHHYTMPIIESQNLTKQVVSPEGTLTILDNVSFSLEAGEACAIVGVSGSGKSTCLGLLAGLDTPTRGRGVLRGAYHGTTH